MVTPDASEATGIPAGTPVIAGSADHIAGALTACLRQSGEAVLEFGGAGNFLYVVEEFRPLPELFIDYHDLPGLFIPPHRAGRTCSRFTSSPASCSTMGK